VNTKGIIAKGMALTRVEIEQTPEMTSASKMVLELEQVIRQKLNEFNPKNSSDESTYGITIQSPPNTSTSVVSLYNKTINFFRGG
jgi:hypothetical protein